MTSRGVSDEVRRFVLLAVPSVPYLEAMLLLRGSPASMGAAEVSRRLYLPEATAAGLLEALVAGGIAVGEPGGTFRYAPSVELARLVDALAAEYSANLIGVADLVHSTVERKAAQFAEAFRIRREK